MSMSMEKTISNNYAHGDLLRAIQMAIVKLGKTTENITIEDLAPVDEFHIGGRQATEHLLKQLNFSEKSHILDVGCGLGGAARFIAQRNKNQVTGIDLTKEFVETGRSLCAWVKLDKQVSLQHGSATKMPFYDESFDGGYMLHVGMNIEDKNRLFQEVHRVLRQGATFGVYDIMRTNEGELNYPVPWATESSTSKLATPKQYHQALINAGFEVSIENNRGEFALKFFKNLRKKTVASGSSSPLGLHILMKESTAEKINNMIDNIVAGFIAPVEIIARKH